MISRILKSLKKFILYAVRATKAVSNPLNVPAQAITSFSSFTTPASVAIRVTSMAIFIPAPKSPNVLSNIAEGVGAFQSIHLVGGATGLVP